VTVPTDADSHHDEDAGEKCALRTAGELTLGGLMGGSRHQFLVENRSRHIFD